VRLGSDVRPLSPPPVSFRVPREEPPYQSSRKERCSLSGALQLSLKFPVKGLPRFPNGPLQRETPVSRAFFYTFPSKSPVNEPPLHVLQQGPYRDRSFTSRDNGLFIHLHLSESPVSSPPTKNGENIWSPSMEPHVDGGPTYNGVRSGSPRGSLTTMLYLPLSHEAFRTIPSTLAWVDQSPASQRVL
jgi:hypothetical protein